MDNKNVLVGALVLSLAANIFFVGFGASRLMHGGMDGHRQHGPRMAGPDGGMEKAISNLEPEYEKKIRIIVDNHRDNVRAQMEEMRGLFEQIGPTLSAPTFDAVKLEDLSAQIDAHDKGMKADMAAMMATIAKTLPDEQRISFFHEMFDGRHKPPGAPQEGRDHHRDEDAPGERPPEE